jgi:hypothetical protein
MKKYLWSFYFDCGRSGSLDGLFVATEEEVNSVIGKHAYFGEVLGKHSEVYGDIEPNDIHKLNISPEAVEEVSAHLGDTWSGFNPLDYAYIQCDMIDIDGNQCEEEGNKDDMNAFDIEGYNYLCYDCYRKQKEKKQNEEE